MKAPILSPSLTYLLDKISDSGYRADIVGGCVRDFLLSRECSDYDVTTNATPTVIKEIFKNDKTVDTGIKHGTVSVIVDGEQYEVTTYRLDGEYIDSRHPKSVTFTAELREDLARRDFTMNAICYSKAHGFYDPFDGRGDIEKRIIRSVGDPVRRFSEDALRILRAIRFRATLGFEIEAQTRAAIHTLAPRLLNISRERVLVEWRKLLAGAYAYDVLCEYPDVIALIIPELAELALPSRAHFDSADPFVKGVALFAGLDSPSEKYESAQRNLHADNKAISLGKTVLENIHKPINDKRSALHLLSKIGEESARILIGVKTVLLEDCIALSALDSIIKSGEPYRLSDLKINGNDLLALGIKGERVGRLLTEALSLVIDGKIENEKGALLTFITENA